MKSTLDAPVLPLDATRAHASAFAFVWHVARGHFRAGNAFLLAGEAVHAGCGIMLPYALSRILNRVTSTPHPGPRR